MDCQECRERLIDLAAGELDKAAEAAVRAHVAACPECARDLAEMESFFATARKELAEPLPDRHSRARFKSATARRTGPRVPLWAAAAAVAIFAALSGAVGYLAGAGSKPLATPTVIVASAGSDFWKVKPEWLRMLPHRSAAQDESGFWNYRRRLEESRKAN